MQEKNFCLAPNVQRILYNVNFSVFSNPRDLSNPLWPKLVIPCDIASQAPEASRKKRRTFITTLISFVHYAISPISKQVHSLPVIFILKTRVTLPANEAVTTKISLIDGVINELNFTEISGQC